jgi:tetratricopeptide (TPR) repeat protein
MTVTTEPIYYPPQAALDALWTAWRAPGGVPLVLVLGPDGVGKSALLDHFAAEVRKDPEREHVLLDRWSPDEFDPFAPFLAQLGLTYILGQLVPGVPRKAMNWAIKLTVPNVPIVGELLGGILESEVQELLDKKPVASDPGTMLRLRQQIADAILRRARGRPVLFIIEDLQYAGEPGLDLLDFLVHALAAAPVLLVVSLRTSAERPDQVPPEVRAHLQFAQGQGRTLVVPALDAAATRRFLDTALQPYFPPAVIAAIGDEAVTATGGVPRQILRLTERLGALRHLDVAGLRNTVREFALNNMSVLSEKEAEIVQLQAVLRAGLPEATFPVIAQTRYWDLSERDLRRYLPKLDHFLTPATLDAVYGGLDPALRTNDHLRCAQILEQAYGDTMPMALVPVVAHHYEEAGNAPRAAQYYLQAGLALTEQNLNDPAREQLERARTLFARLEEYGTLGEIDYLLGWTHYKTGECALAKRDMQQALADYDQQQARNAGGNGALRARRDRAALLLGVITAVGEQHYDEAVPHLQAVVDSPDARVRALARITLGYCLYRKDPDEAERLARAGLAEARRHDNPFTVAQALQYLAIILLHRQDPALIEEAVGSLEEAVRYAEADKYLLGQIYNTLGEATARRGDDATAIRYLRESLALKQQTGDVMGQAFSHGALGRAYRRMGRLDEALDSFHRDLAIIEQEEGQEAPRIQMHCELADVQRLRGDHAAAWRELVRADAVIATLPDGPLRRRQEAFRTLTAAQVDRALGRREEALAHIRWARETFEAIGFRFMLPFCALVEGGLLRETGDLPAAAARLAEAAAGRFDPYEAAWLAWEQALLARAQGDFDAAGAHLTTALALARQLRNAWLERRFVEV